MSAHLYALGSNFAGQLGIGHRDDASTPYSCFFVNEYGISASPGSKIRKVVSGGGHTICLCTDGRAYAAGQVESLGQTVGVFANGASHRDRGSSFWRVGWMEGEETIDRFIDVAATWTASFFMTGGEGGQMTGTGKIFAVGSGALGLGEGISHTQEPKLVALYGKDNSADPENGVNGVPNIPHALSNLCAGVWNVVAASASGHQLYGWGECKKGEFGDVNQPKRFLHSPTKIFDTLMSQDKTVDCMTKIGVGRSFIVTHRCVVSGNGSPISSWRVHGQFVDAGLKSFLEELEARTVLPENSRESLVPAVGWSNLYVLDSRSGKVSAVGKNTLGEMPPDGLPPLKELSAGSAHCVGLTKEGQVIAWGWSEHGNCGDQSSASDGWSIIKPAISSSEKMVGVGAGGATTFIWTTVDKDLRLEELAEKDE